MNNNYGLIMAGGIGSRFWPMSTSRCPKQFHDILGTGKTFLQQTFSRLCKIIPSNQIYVITTKNYVDLTLEQLPQINKSQIIIEPIGRNTAPCNLYAALKIQQLNPQANILVAPADHLILDEDIFAQKAELAFDKAQANNALITLGITPTRPDTGYGYIQFLGGDDSCKIVKTFTEKPSLEIAQQFIASGDFLWNAGIFIWSAKGILTAFKEHLPDMYTALDSVKEHLNSNKETEVIAKTYPTLQKISIDNGILEKASNVMVIPSSFGWSDIGTWGSLYENTNKDQNGNTLQGKHILTYNTQNTLIKNTTNKAIVVNGLDDFIVVNTTDALLVCPRSKDQEVKRAVNDFKIKQLDEFV